MSSPYPHDWLFAHAERSPDAPAIATPSVRLTYGELAERVRVFAGHLAASGVGPGGRVMIALPNVPATVVAGLAVHLLGATAVEVNREWGPDVLSELVRRTGVRHVVALGRDARAWAQVAAAHPLERIWAVHPGPLPPAMLETLAAAPVSLLLDDGRVDPSLGAPPPPPPVELRAEHPALILFTSGSTGTPRGVIQTFGNLGANTRSIVEYLELTAEDRALLVLPLYYCYGRSVLQTHLFVGASLFLDNRFAFPRTVLEAFATEGCTSLAGVPLTFEIIRRQVDVSTLAFPRLRYLTQAGGSMAPDTIDWVRRAFQPARLFVMYGQTEATARLAYLPPERAADKRGSIGIAIPGVELQVVDEQGHELPRGETGHLVARGGNVTLGYLDAPEETASILHDGWLWTGDLARRDEEGFFFHEGRSKDILKVKGHRVSPLEIEHVLGGHPDLADVAVIGAKHELWGEVPIAFVVPAPGATPTHEQLLGWCRERLPSFKVPARFTVLEALPRNESGKLLRAELAARAADD